MEMRILPLNDGAPLSESESRVLAAVGEGAAVKTIMTRLGLRSLHATQSRIQRLVKKGVLMITRTF